MATFSTKTARAATPALTPFVDELPIPHVLTGATLSLTADPSTHKFHRDLPETDVWGYNGGAKTGGYLGPTIEIHKDSTTTVNFTNNLPSEHLLPVDPAVAGDRGTAPRILTHLHGGFVSGDDDGNPYATLDEFQTGEKQTVTYPTQPRATTLWYHDHALGMTRLNVYAGLAAFFLVRDENDTGEEPNPLGIPGGDYEVPIVIQDKSFTAVGQLFYSDEAEWEPEFFGDTPVINGAVQPYLEVEPRMYRLRLLNGSQSRFYHLQLSNRLPFYQIGSEGGLFNKPVRVNSILLLPAERADVIVDFRGLAGEDIVLNNLPLPAGVVSPAEPELPELMQFRVRSKTPAGPAGPTSIPKTLAGGSLANVKGPIAKKRYITLEEVLDENDEPVRLEINGRIFDEPVDENPTAGTVEEWWFVNISADTHPIHMHLTQFQVMGRIPLDGEAYAQDLENARALAMEEPLPHPARPAPPPLLANNTIDPTPYMIGREVLPPRNEKGWKDTVGAHPNQVTRIRQRFDLPSGVTGTQKYVYHCHILEHEDNDMMRPYEVVS